jgi:hypothetical protein
MAAHAKTGDSMSFYEINPVVRDFADNYFSYIQDAESRGAKCDVILGDARISLERQLESGQPQRFDVLVLDAFSSDAIPAHLLTREATELYLQHLRNEGDRQGILAVHISNRYLDLFPITRALADDFDLDIAQVDTKADDDTTAYAAHWVLLARQGGLDEIVRNAAHVSLDDKAAGDSPSVLWTDDYTNILRVLDID